jgi:hypothetical protein
VVDRCLLLPWSVVRARYRYPVGVCSLDNIFIVKNFERRLNPSKLALDCHYKYDAPSSVGKRWRGDEAPTNSPQR